MALSKRYSHDNLYQKYDMTPNEIHIGTGIVKVHDIFDPIPEFMRSADCIFSDPPCSNGNLSSFYTKAEIDQEAKKFDGFMERFFECVSEISPDILILETFKANHNKFLERVQAMYPNVKVFDSMYYRNPKNHCNIIVASKNPLPADLGIESINGMDEEDVIKWVCSNVPFNCIGDLCMGKGLVGFYANKFGKRFVGTELNKKRLAVLMERITTGKRGHIN